MNPPKEPVPHLSPCGRYLLTVETKGTRPGCWNHTVGIVTRVDSGEQVARVDRNYSSFPYEWVTPHPNGHDYLVCGADYQGQTVLELDTGKRRDLLGKEAARGNGFCWASYRWEPRGQLLLVDGCYWACPYEWRVFAFDSPMEAGWPELEFPEDCAADSSRREPEVNADGTLTFYETRELEGQGGEDDADDPYETVAWQRYRREGLALVQVESWLDPAEQQRRDDYEAARQRWEAEWVEYKATDPLYLLMRKRTAAARLGDRDHVSLGGCYAGWCPDYTGNDRRVCYRAVDRHMHDGTQYTVDLEWGMREAPVKLDIYRDGGSPSAEWFPRTLEGMNAALDRIFALMGVTG